MFLTHAVDLFYDALLTLAYPQICGLCGRSVEQRRFGVACESCWKETPIFTDDKTICWKCGLPAPAEVAAEFREQVRCRRCDPLAFTAARAAGPYDGALRESVLFLKRQPNVSRHVEDLLVAVSMRVPLSESTRVVAVPLHPKRMRARGFNQAFVLAQSLSKRIGLPLDEVSLERVVWSEKYRAGLDVKGRRETVTGAFQVRYPRLVAGENVLLVDDVFTTGATVSACAEALSAAGAANVHVLTVARA